MSQATETVTATVARWVASLEPSHIPDEVMAAARRFLLDSVGCALGGSQQEDVALMQRTLDQVAGDGPCTALVTGQKLDALSASLLNALLIRVMDYNDIYWQQDPSHPSDIIPAAMAAAELADATVADMLVGIVVAYELEQRLCEISFPGIRELGWHHATLTAVAAAAAAGKVLGLDADQLQHAMGISGSRHCTTGSVTAGKLTMMKNTVDPLATQSGVLAALMAREGYTGPEHVLDGKEGFSHVFDSEWRFDVLTEGLGDADQWRILRCGMKFFPTEALTHAPLSAVLDLVQTHDLKPDDIQQVTIHSLARAADILADPSKYDPRSKETADHSLPYVVAAALVDRQVTPRQFDQDRIMDPVIRAQLPKVKVVADAEIEALFPGLQRVRVEIQTTDGRTVDNQLDYPKGDPRNPLTDEELWGKVTALGRGVVADDKLQAMRELILSGDAGGSARAFMAVLAA